MKIKIFDSNGTELKIGDKVKIQDRRNRGLTFYSTVQLINGQLFPFSKFAYDRIIKVDEIPADCRHSKSDKNMPEYWMHPQQKLEIFVENKLEKWRMEIVYFTNNPFYKITL